GGTYYRQFVDVRWYFAPHAFQPLGAKIADHWFAKHHRLPRRGPEEPIGQHVQEDVGLRLVVAQDLIRHFGKEKHLDFESFRLQLPYQRVVNVRALDVYAG